MAVAPFNHITATYTGLHAWMYETIVAPAVYRSRQIIDERFLQHLPQGAHILDVGSGGGLFTNYIADQRPDLNIIGIDLSEPQLKRASKRMRTYADRVKFQKGDATKMDFAGPLLRRSDQLRLDQTLDLARGRACRMCSGAQTRRPAAGHRCRPQHHLRRREELHHALQDAAAFRRHQSRDLPHLDRRPLHRPRRRAHPRRTGPISMTWTSAASLIHPSS